MIANSGEAQTVEVDLSAFTNWSGPQGNWWFQLVENPGEGAVASAGAMDIQQILFTTESINPVSENYQTILDFEQGSAEGFSFGGSYFEVVENPSTEEVKFHKMYCKYLRKKVLRFGQVLD